MRIPTDQEFNQRPYVKGVLQFGGKRKIIGGAFIFGALILIVLEAVKVIIWDIKEKLKEKDKGWLPKYFKVKNLRERNFRDFATFLPKL